MRQDKQEAIPDITHLQLSWILDFKPLQLLQHSNTDYENYDNLGNEARHAGKCLSRSLFLPQKSRSIASQLTTGSHI